mmetsp:Transcript_41961/g.82400  ORF Transcript_41961/g.82400 Transcript_41961/m.82400 type:complete len:205 (+) Transcript_41961:1215-1829(+)
MGNLAFQSLIAIIVAGNCSRNAETWRMTKRKPFVFVIPITNGSVVVRPYASGCTLFVGLIFNDVSKSSARRLFAQLNALNMCCGVNWVVFRWAWNRQQVLADLAKHSLGFVLWHMYFLRTLHGKVRSRTETRFLHSDISGISIFDEEHGRILQSINTHGTAFVSPWKAHRCHTIRMCVLRHSAPRQHQSCFLHCCKFSRQFPSF